MTRPVLVAFALSALCAAPAAGAPITTVAGTLDQTGFAGDGGPAVAAKLALPVGVTPTSDGGYLIADQANNRVRRVSPDGTITTIGGATAPGFSGDGGPAVGARMSAPSGVAQLPDGSVLVADANNNRVRRIGLDGTMTTVVGTGAAAYGGDGGPAAAAQINFPYDIQPLPEGGYLLTDSDNNRIRKVSAAGTITTVAGDGGFGPGGDGGPATSASLADPSGTALLPGGGFLIADVQNDRIRKVDAAGTITTAASGFDGPWRVAALPDGSFVVADRGRHRIVHVDTAGTKTVLAGDGTAGATGDGDEGTLARLDEPIGVATTAHGDVLVADTFNHAIRRIDLTPDAGPPPPPPPPPPAATFEAVPPTVRLAIAPNPTCVGVPTTIDASASVPGNGGPIVRYEFLGSAIASTMPAAAGKPRGLSPVGVLQMQLAAVVEQQQRSGLVSPLGALPTPTTTTAFSWLAAQQAGSAEVKMTRPPSDVTVIVTDAAGQKAAAQMRLEFTQSDPRDERRRCPRTAVVAEPSQSSPQVRSELAIDAKALQVQVGCAAARLLGQGCTGAVQITAPSYALATQEAAAEVELAEAKRAASSGAGRKQAEVKQRVEEAQREVDRVKAEIRRLVGQMSQANQKLAQIAARRRPAPAVAGRRAYRVAAGARAALSVPLSRRARAILRRHRRLRVTVSTTAVSATGTPTIKSKPVTLTVSRRRGG